MGPGLCADTGRGRTALRKWRVSGLRRSALRCCFLRLLARALYYCGAVCAGPSPRDELGSSVVISSCSSFADKSEALLYPPPLPIPANGAQDGKDVGISSKTTLRDLVGTGHMVVW